MRVNRAEPTGCRSQKLIANPIVGKAIREELEMPTGKLTQTDLEKVSSLNLEPTKITDAGLKEVASLLILT